MNKITNPVYSSLLIILFLSFTCSCQTQSQEKTAIEKSSPGSVTSDKENQSKGSGPSAAFFSAPKKEEVKEFVSTEYGFKVDLPGDPEFYQPDPQLPPIFSLEREGGYYMISVGKAAGDITDEKLLDAVSQGLLSADQAKEAKTRKFTQGEMTISEYSLVSQRGGSLSCMKARYILVGKKVYHLRSMAYNWQLLPEDKKEAFESEAKRFFDSFNLIKK